MSWRELVQVELYTIRGGVKGNIEGSNVEDIANVTVKGYESSGKSCIWNTRTRFRVLPRWSKTKVY
jgi:hypothetical protein